MQGCGMCRGQEGSACVRWGGQAQHTAAFRTASASAHTPSLTPNPHPTSPTQKLYICEYSLKYFRKKATLLRHLAKLKERHPPGDEIYRSPAPPTNNPGYIGGAVANPPVAVFEVRALTQVGFRGTRMRLL